VDALGKVDVLDDVLRERGRVPRRAALDEWADPSTRPRAVGEARLDECGLDRRLQRLEELLGPDRVAGHDDRHVLRLVVGRVVLDDCERVVEASVKLLTMLEEGGGRTTRRTVLLGELAERVELAARLGAVGVLLAVKNLSEPVERRQGEERREAGERRKGTHVWSSTSPKLPSRACISEKTTPPSSPLPSMW